MTDQTPFQSESKGAGGNNRDDAYERRRRLGALFPEVPVDAERQVLGLSLLVGAIVFSGIMGWGPHGRWLNGLHAPRGTANVAALGPVAGHNATSDRGRDNRDEVRGSSPVTTSPATKAPAIADVALTTDVQSAATDAQSAATDAASLDIDPTVAPLPVDADSGEADATEAVGVETEPIATTAAPTTAAPTTAPPPTTAAPTTPAASPVGALPSATVYFAGGSAVVEPSGRDALQQVADAIASLPAGSNVTIIGWASPEGGADRNQALSVARAEAVRTVITDLVGPRNTDVTYRVEGRGTLRDDPAPRKVTVELS